MTSVVTIPSLIQDARTARENAYAPYSDFQVGAALETSDGEVYTGCNVEISGRNTSTHAEMLAVFKAVTDGATDFERLAVSCSDEKGHFPCALCMHTLSEFMTDVEVITDGGDEFETYSLDDQYEDAYRPGDHD